MTLSASPPVAIITGAARGIGAATARALAQQGWSLILVDACADEGALAYSLAGPDDLEQTRQACGGDHRAVAIEADVRDPQALAVAVREGVDRFGGLDAALAIAGAIAGGNPAWETSDDTWRAMTSINLDGCFHLARAAIPAMLERPEPRRGRFVAVASAGGSVGLPLLSAYCAAKAGVIGFVRALAAELGPHGITANVIAPGSTATAMLDASTAIYRIADREEFATHHMIPRLLEPGEPAAAAAWLCSLEADGVTGALLPVDAGMTAR